MNFLLYLRWSVSPEILHFGNVSVRWYGLLFALTFIVGYEILAYIFRRENVDVKKLDVLTIYIVLGTVIGARLGHCLFYSPSYYLSNPIEIIKIWEGGLASHGGAIGIIFAIWLFVRRNRSFSMLWILDRLVIVVALGGLFIRTGNFFNSEIYGLPSTAPWAVIFTAIDEIPRHPTQLYEGLVYFCIFLLLFSIYKTKGFNNFKSGFIFGLFFILTFTARFLIEFVKEVQSSFESGMVLDMGQILSIPFILIGIYFVCRPARKNIGKS